MPKSNTVFVCQECGYESPKWLGQCICGAWNSFIEERLPPANQKSSRLGDISQARRKTASPVPLKDVTTSTVPRSDTGIGELNRVLGGGIVPGSLILLAGEPGIGKSTLILQTALSLTLRDETVLYVSGEESETQIRLRADRLTENIPGSLLMLSETNVEAILEHAISTRPSMIIIDSIQTMYSEMLESAAGSVSQVRTCTSEIMRIAKDNEIPVFIVAHVTKSGELAGPKIIEHLVDCVLLFTGDRTQDLRILRSQKNRFGTTSEIGAFDMRESGLAEIPNLSGVLLDNMDKPGEGQITTAVYEGTRTLLLEMQALTAAAAPGFGRRTAIGIENARLAMIIAVLERKAHLDLSAKDVFVNVVGGIKTEGTSTDLAVALAIWSSAKGIPLPPRCCAIGELGLTGELRPVRSPEKIVGEAVKLGFKTLILPQKSLASIKKTNNPQSFDGIELCGHDDILSVLEFLRD